VSDATETVVEAGWIIPVEPAGAVLQDHAVVISGERIHSIVPVREARTRHPDANRVNLAGHVLIPGFINLHTHAAMTLMRGLGDDLALMEWLNQRIWPAEMRLASPEFVYDGTLLACAEMLRGGITCFNDMYFFPEAAGRAALAAGMRGALGIIVIEFRSPYATHASDYLTKGLETRDALKHESLLSFCLAPHAPFTVSDATFERLAVYAAELDLPLHIHLHETAGEISESVASHNLRPLRRLQKLGLLGPNLLAVHAVHLGDDEIELLAEHACHIAHCPASNLKLASGIARVAALHEAGVNIGLGTDGAASNNRLDMFSEMRLEALLAKGVSGNATALPAHAVLRMATLNGARALGLDKTIGSLVPGKLADLIAVDLSTPDVLPCYDPASHLVYVAGRNNVSHVWVGGELVVEGGRLTHIQDEELRGKAAHWHDKIRNLDAGSSTRV